MMVSANHVNQVIGIFQFLLHLCSQLCQLKCSYHYDLYNLGIFYARVCVCVRVCVCITSFGNMKPFGGHIMACRLFATLLWFSWLSHNYGPAKLFQPSQVPMQILIIMFWLLLCTAWAGFHPATRFFL